MFRRLRLLLGISVFWLALSMLTDGVNTLVLPLQLNNLVGKSAEATGLGLLTFVGLLLGALMQPYAGAASDRARPMLARKGFIAIGLLLSLAALAAFALLRNLPGLMMGYLGIQLSASIAQAGQQGLIPDLVDEEHRGIASGLKGFMDVGGAMVGFLVLGHLLGSGNLVTAVLVIAGTLLAVYAIAALVTPEDSARVGRLAAPQRALSLRQSFGLNFQEHRPFIRLLLARFLFLLGIYAVGRFLLYFVSDRLHVQSGQAALQAGNILAVLTLITVLASPPGGWLADRFGRRPLIIAGAVLGGLSALLLIFARTETQILLFGGLMSLGSAAFSGGSWALLADLVPKQEAARFFGLANFSTAGSSALAGLFGPILDASQRALPGSGYIVLFILAALAFLASAFPLTPSLMKEVSHVQRGAGNQAEIRTDPAGLAVVPVPAHSAGLEEDQDPQARPAAP